MIGHIDGAAATTYLITIPTMLPIYKKMHIRPTVLKLLLCGAATGIMNPMCSWGGPTIRAATTRQRGCHGLWIKMIPMQVFGPLCNPDRHCHLPGDGGDKAPGEARHRGLRPGGRRVRGDEYRPVLKTPEASVVT